jgi:chemotaxis protein MotB
MATRAILFAAAAALLAAGCVSQQTHNEALDRNAQLEKEYQELNQTMSSEVSSRDVHIERLQDAIKVSVNSELLFPSGGWEMPDSAKASIAKIAKVLAPHQKSKIDVNGYTDTTPIGPGLAKQGITTNEILSKKRADTVMQYMISQGVKPELVAAHGYGEATPVAPNDTAEGRAQNRRVELTIAK